MDVEFNASEPNTLGVEIEYALVDVTKGDLVCCATPVLEEMGAGHPDGVHPKAKNELYQSTIEVITGINRTVAEARADLERTTREVQTVLAPRHVGLACPGVHPFSEWYDLELTRTPRYDALIDSIQWPARRLMTHGVHFHVGVRSGEKAVAITNALVTYLPYFLALSASSPYWHGHDTGLASVRTKIFESVPTTGLPPRLADWSEFQTFMGALLTAGAIESVREVWWDIRPHPDFGTVELRMCDGIPTLHEVTALAALAQSLVAHLDAMHDRGEPLPVPREWIARENKWRAARWGVDAQVVIDETGRCEPLDDGVRSIVAMLMPTARTLGCADELLSVLDILEAGASYARQRRIVADGGSLVDVVAALQRELLADRPGA